MNEVALWLVAGIVLNATSAALYEDFLPSGSAALAGVVEGLGIACFVLALICGVSS